MDVVPRSSGPVPRAALYRWAEDPRCDVEQRRSQRARVEGDTTMRRGAKSSCSWCQLEDVHTPSKLQYAFAVSRRTQSASDSLMKRRFEITCGEMSTRWRRMHAAL